MVQAHPPADVDASQFRIRTHVDVAVRIDGIFAVEDRQVRIAIDQFGDEGLVVSLRREYRMGTHLFRISEFEIGIVGELVLGG